MGEHDKVLQSLLGEGITSLASFETTHKITEKELLMVIDQSEWKFFFAVIISFVRSLARWIW